MKEVKFPQVWGEDGKEVKAGVLEIGHFVKVKLNSANFGESEFLGIYRGTEGYECGKLILIEVAQSIMPDTAGRCCHSEIKKYDPSFVSLIEILARNHHAVFQLFHAYGVLKVRHAFLREKADIAVTNLLGYKPSPSCY